MGKGIKKPAKPAKDFKKKKFKVGRTLSKAQNETSVDVRVRKLNLPGQTALDDKSSLPTSDKNLTLTELLGQLSHYSEKTRKVGLQGLASLLQRHPVQLTRHMSPILSAVGPLISDAAAAVRGAVCALYGDVIAPAVPEAQMGPVLPLLMAHLVSAMTHLQLAIRLDAFALLQAVVAHCPALVAAAHGVTLLQQFAAVLSEDQRYRTLKARSISALKATIDRLRCILDALARSYARNEPRAGPVGASSDGSVPPSISSGVPRPEQQSHVTRVLATIPAQPTLPGGFVYAVNSVDAAHLNPLRSSTVSGKSEASMEAAAAALASNLIAAWDECAPSQVAISPDAATLECLLGMLDCHLSLLALLSIPNLSQGATSLQRSTQERYWHFVRAKLCTVFPAALPAVTASEAIKTHLVAFNTLSTRFITALLPLTQSLHGPTSKSLAGGAVASSAQATKKRARSRPQTSARSVPASSEAELTGSVTALAHTCVGSSNAYARYCDVLSAGEVAAGPPSHEAMPGTEAQGQASHSSTAPVAEGWLQRFVEFLEAVLVQAVAVPPQADIMNSVAGVPAPAATFSAALQAVEAVLPLVDATAQSALLQALAQLGSDLTTSRRIELVRFQHRLHLAATHGAAAASTAVITSSVATQWAACLPQAIWELSEVHPEVASAALDVLHGTWQRANSADVARAWLRDLEPQLAAILGVIVVAGKKGRGVSWVPGPLFKLPAAAQRKALGLLASLRPLSPRTIAVLPLAARCKAMPPDIVHRIASILEHSAADGPPEPVLTALLSLLLDIRQATYPDSPLTADLGPEHTYPVTDLLGSDAAGANTSTCTAAWERCSTLAQAAASALCRLHSRCDGVLPFAFRAAGAHLDQAVAAGAATEVVLQRAYSVLALAKAARRYCLFSAEAAVVPGRAVRAYFEAWLGHSEEVTKAADPAHVLALGAWPVRDYSVPHAVPHPAALLQEFVDQGAAMAPLAANAVAASTFLNLKSCCTVTAAVADAPAILADVDAKHNSVDPVTALKRLHGSLSLSAAMLYLVPARALREAEGELMGVYAAAEDLAGRVFQGDAMRQVVQDVVERQRARLQNVIVTSQA